MWGGSSNPFQGAPMPPTDPGPASTQALPSGPRPWPLLRLALLCTLVVLPVAAEAPALPPKSVPELKAFFQQNCTRCHGLDGSAKSPEGKRLGGLDFTRAAQDFRTLSGPASEREIRTMIRTIRRGIFFGRSMPSWKDQLSLEDATIMVKEILLKAEAGRAIEP